MKDGKPVAPAAHPAARLPKLRLPPLACDAHCHIFGPFARFPLPADRSFTPQEAPPDANWCSKFDEPLRERTVPSKP